MAVSTHRAHRARCSGGAAGGGWRAPVTFVQRFLPYEMKHARHPMGEQEGAHHEFKELQVAWEGRAKLERTEEECGPDSAAPAETESCREEQKKRNEANAHCS